MENDNKVDKNEISFMNIKNIFNVYTNYLNKPYYRKALLLKHPDKKLLFGRPVAIFGAGRMGEAFAKKIHLIGIKANYFIDNDKNLQGRSIGTIPIISLEEARLRIINQPILVASLLHETDICTDLLDYGFPMIFPLVYLNFLYPKVFYSPEYSGIFVSLFNKENQKKMHEAINVFSDTTSKEIFLRLLMFRLTFEKSYLQQAYCKQSAFTSDKLLNFSNNEIFVDGGAYTGDSIEAFIKAVHGKYKSILSFEPDEINYEHLSMYCKSKHFNRITLIKKGIYVKNGKVFFSVNGRVDARILDKTYESIKNNERRSIETTSLDTYFSKREKPTLIKMDIEGAENEALRGASGLIRKHRPKLMISVYHHAEDLWNIPLLIKKLHPDYRLYLRHFSNETVDTICYAC